MCREVRLFMIWLVVMALGLVVGLSFQIDWLIKSCVFVTVSVVLAVSLVDPRSSK